MKTLSKYKGLIKLGISVLMLVLVFRLVDFGRLREVILNIPLWVAFTVIVGYTCGQVLSSIKWWTLARAGHIDSSYTTALRAYFIGMFVNCYGLGTVGGDVTRGVLLADGKPLKAAGVASVLADRLHGLAMLALIGSSAIILLGAPEHLDPLLVLLLCSIGPLVILGWFLGPLLVLRFVPVHNRFRAKIEQMVRVFPRSPTVLFKITLLAVLFHLLQIGLHWVMARGVGVDIPWHCLLVIIPFVNMVSTLPISWNGLGVRENAYVFFLTPAFLSKEQAIAFGAIWILAVTIASSIGGLVSVLSREDLVKDTAKFEGTEEKLESKGESYMRTSL